MGKHVHRESDVLFDGHGVKQGIALKEHAHLHAQLAELGLVEVAKVDVVIPNLAFRRSHESHQDLE